MLIKSELPSEFTINGSEYRRHENGVIEQLNPGEYVYDRHYIEARYETYPKEQMTACAFLRLGLVLSKTGNDGSGRNRPLELLDYGYGNGAFLRAAVQHPNIAANGLEINGWPIPEGAREIALPFADEWDTVCFFDVAEHIQDLTRVLSNLRTLRVVISLPWCHANAKGLEWFKTWKHRRPGEHIWHFDAESLRDFLWQYEFNTVYIGNPEDAVRRPTDGLPNILTVIAERF